MNKWLHIHEVKDILKISELELMKLVSQGVLTGFDQNYKKVKHYGRWYIDQKEDERLPPNILSNRVSYFDRGDIIDYGKKNGLKLKDRNIEFEQLKFELSEDIWIKVKYEGSLVEPNGNINERAIFRYSKHTGFKNWIKKSLSDPRQYRKPTDDELNTITELEYKTRCSQPKIKPCAEQEVSTNANEFIRNLKVGLVNNKQVVLMPKGNKAEEYSCEEIGFQETAKTWQMFIDVLQKDDHTYHTGIYSKNKKPADNKEYYKNLATLRAFSKKFIAFLNKKYLITTPKDLKNVFENLKGIERDGTYRPIFKVFSYDTNRNLKSKITSKEQLLENLTNLSEQRRQEQNTDKKDAFLLKIGELLELGKKKNWISSAQASRFLHIDDEEMNSLSDALDHTIDIKHRFDA